MAKSIEEYRPGVSDLARTAASQEKGGSHRLPATLCLEPRHREDRGCTEPLSQLARHLSARRSRFKRKSEGCLNSRCQVMA